MVVEQRRRNKHLALGLVGKCMDARVFQEVDENLAQCAGVAVQFKLGGHIDHQLGQGTTSAGFKRLHDFIDAVSQRELPPPVTGLVDGDIFEIANQLGSALQAAHQHRRRQCAAFGVFLQRGPPQRAIGHGLHKFCRVMFKRGGHDQAVANGCVEFVRHTGHHGAQRREALLAGDFVLCKRQGINGSFQLRIGTSKLRGALGNPRFQVLVQGAQGRFGLAHGGHVQHGAHDAGHLTVGRANNGLVKNDVTLLRILGQNARLVHLGLLIGQQLPVLVVEKPCTFGGGERAHFCAHDACTVFPKKLEKRIIDALVDHGAVLEEHWVGRGVHHGLHQCELLAYQPCCPTLDQHHIDQEAHLNDEQDKHRHRGKEQRRVGFPDLCGSIDDACLRGQLARCNVKPLQFVVVERVMVGAGRYGRQCRDRFTVHQPQQQACQSLALRFSGNQHAAHHTMSQKEVPADVDRVMRMVANEPGCRRPCNQVAFLVPRSSHQEDQCIARDGCKL